ncbi:MAG: hypothetical protein U1F34_00850 [Gammaproteobacteria bacterium]
MRHDQSAAALIEAPIGAAPVQSSVAAVPNAVSRLAWMGSGHLLYGLFNHFFDFVLYPFVVYRLGVVVGGTAMTLASLAQCAVTLIAYQRMGIDWVGGSLIDDIAKSYSNARLGRVLAHLTSNSRALTFFALCAVTDPFIVTAFFRRGRFHALTAQDWNLFLASVVVCNLYWIVVADLIAHGAVVLWSGLMNWIAILQGML